MQIFQAGSCLPPSKLETEWRAVWHPSPVPADACGVRSGLFKGIPSVRIILPLCLLPIQSFVRRHEELGDIRKGSEDWNPPPSSVSAARSRGGGAAEDASRQRGCTHLLHGRGSGDTSHLGCAAFNPCLSPRGKRCLRKTWLPGKAAQLCPLGSPSSRERGKSPFCQVRGCSGTAPVLGHTGATQTPWPAER